MWELGTMDVLKRRRRMQAAVKKQCAKRLNRIKVTKIPLAATSSSQGICIESGENLFNMMPPVPVDDWSVAVARFLKYFSLTFLVFQNAALALSMRYGRTRSGDMFLSSTAVLMSEIVKLLICLYVVFVENGKVLAKLLNTLKTAILVNKVDTLKVCVPSFVYVLQNNLLYVAASHLDAATYQVTYQLKILTTAIISILILRTKLNIFQWTSLLILILGVVLVQLAKPDDGHPGSVATGAEQNRIIGFLSAITACFLSGFAGVYFEKILKFGPHSVWLRNVQLSLCSIPFAFLTSMKDYSEIKEKGFFYGYDFFIWYLIILQAGGGLLVAVVVKYADNILKGFATSLAIVVACVASIILFDFVLTVQFTLGTSLVISSIFLYGYKPPSTVAPAPGGISNV